MKRTLPLVLLFSIFGTELVAQVSPLPSPEDPRTRTVTYSPGASIRLVTFADASMIVLFHPGERIERILLSDGDAFRVAVVGNRDAVELAPLGTGASASMRVASNLADYVFELETGRDPTAAYLVRFVRQQAEPARAAAPQPGTGRWDYRLSGKRNVMPRSILDDGSKTFIEFPPNQSLPAIFGIGATGGEEIVAGYMRSGIFVIDRVYPALVFRIDRSEATATRQEGRN